MVGKKKRRGSHPALMGSHQKCWLWGRHAVMETLRARKWIPLEVVWSTDFLTRELELELLRLTGQQRIPTHEASPEEMQRFCGSSEHQGLLAKMPIYPYADADRVLTKLTPTQNVLMLCGIQDPFNFGSILRSADLFGQTTVVVAATGQAAVSSHVVRSSVGAVNFLDVVQVENLSDYADRLKQAGFRLVAATERGEVAPSAINMTSGIVLLIGNEGSGVPESLLAQCDEQIAIPQTGHVGSLNAAVAAGILCYEIQRQRQLSSVST